MKRAESGLIMILKLELGLAGVALGAAALWGANADPVIEAPAPARYDRFTQADYQAFDRDFDLEGSTCKVGVKRSGICFRESPLEKALTVGATVPANLPYMPAEFPVIVRTDLKAENLQTWRFGRSLVLVHRETQEVVDVLDLSAPEQRRVGTAILASGDMDAGTL